jgi:hypothetical protein
VLGARCEPVSVGASGQVVLAARRECVPDVRGIIVRSLIVGDLPTKVTERSRNVLNESADLLNVRAVVEIRRRSALGKRIIELT